MKSDVTVGTGKEVEIHPSGERDEKTEDRILIVDDDPSVVDFLSRVLSKKGFGVDEAVSYSQAVRFFGQGDGYSLVLTDLSLPDGSGIDLVNHVHQSDPSTVCILITGYGTMESAIEAIHASVYDFLPKPFEVQHLLSTIRKGLEKRRLEIENRKLLEELRQERALLRARVREATENLESKLRQVEALNNEITVLYEIMRDIRGDIRMAESLERLVDYLERAVDFESSFWLVSDSNDRLITARDWETGPDRKYRLRDLSPSQLEEFRSLIQSTEEVCEQKERVSSWMQLSLECEIAGGGIVFAPFKTSSDFVGIVGLVRESAFEGETDRLLCLAVSQLVTVWEENAVLRRGSQMASIGELTAEVAHDLRNGLSAFRHISDHFFDQVDMEDPRNQEYQEVLLENLERTEGLVQEILSLARPEGDHFQTTPLQHLLDRVLKISSKTLERNGVEYHIEVEDESMIVNGSLRELSECLINVIMNSIQAMKGGGVLTLTVTSIEKTEDGDRAGSRFAKITVRDTGEGIAPENLKKVFNRYFTTKKEGTGLGLSMLQKVVKKYLGWVEIESELGQGTAVTVFLPQV